LNTQREMNYKKDREDKLDKQLLIRDVPTSESGKEEISALKSFLLNEYKNLITQNQLMFNELHRGINLRLNETFEQKKLKDNSQANFSRNILNRSEIIECINFTDAHLELILHYHQLKVLGKPIEKIKHYQKVNDGLNLFLKKLKVPYEIQKLKSRIDLYRKLRHQFAHYNYGIFVFEAKHNAFERFLKQLHGIEIKEEYNTYIDGKLGVVLKYNFTGNDFIKELYPQAFEYIARLIEFMLPSSTYKAFPYKGFKK